jgi:hypothetical protein
MNMAYLDVFNAMIRVRCPDACPIRTMTATLVPGAAECSIVRTFQHINGSDKEWKCTATVKWSCVIRCLEASALFDIPKRETWTGGDLACGVWRENHGVAKASAAKATQAEAAREAIDKAEAAAFAASNGEIHGLKCPADCPDIRFTYVQRRPRVTAQQTVLGNPPGFYAEAECEWAHRFKCMSA